MSYKSYFTDVDESIDTYEAIGELLGMGWKIGEIEKKLNVSARLIVKVLDTMISNEMKNIIFERTMEKYDERII